MAHGNRELFHLNTDDQKVNVATTGIKQHDHNRQRVAKGSDAQWYPEHSGYQQPTLP